MKNAHLAILVVTGVIGAHPAASSITLGVFAQNPHLDHSSLMQRMVTISKAIKETPCALGNTELDPLFGMIIRLNKKTKV